MKTFKEYLETVNGTWVLDEKNWIQGAVKHPGRCTKGSPNYDCPEGSPQWKLAQRFRHGDIHRDNEKKHHKKKHKKKED